MITLDEIGHRYALTDDEKRAVVELYRVLPCDLEGAAQLIRQLGKASETSALSLRAFAACQIEVYPETIHRMAESIVRSLKTPAPVASGSWACVFGDRSSAR